MESIDSMTIPEDKKRYIVDVLNPILEEMVAECINKAPDQPGKFMLEWLLNHKAKEEDASLTPETKVRLEKENLELEGSVAKVKAEASDVAKMVHAHDEGEEHHDDEEEHDESDDEPPPGWEKSAATLNKCRQSVSAEAYGEWNTKKAFNAPVIAKSAEQKGRLNKCLNKSFLFQCLEEQDLAVVVGAMTEFNAEPKQRIINQGDDGDFLFVIESGTLDCIIKQADGSEKVVKTCEPGDVFGELALLYNCPRAASVESKDKCVLWQLDRDTFNNIVKEAAQRKREKYEAFLSKVPLTHDMGAYERSQLADALKSETFQDGMEIVRQSDVGSSFYIIEDGEAVAEKNGIQVMTYKPGDVFGELALIRNQPRAATVKAKGTTKVLSLGRSGFKRLIPVETLVNSGAYA